MPKLIILKNPRQVVLARLDRGAHRGTLEGSRNRRDDTRGAYGRGDYHQGGRDEERLYPGMGRPDDDSSDSGLRSKNDNAEMGARPYDPPDAGRGYGRGDPAEDRTDMGPVKPNQQIHTSKRGAKYVITRSGRKRYIK